MEVAGTLKNNIKKIMTICNGMFWSCYFYFWLEPSRKNHIKIIYRWLNDPIYWNQNIEDINVFEQACNDYFNVIYATTFNK